MIPSQVTSTDSLTLAVAAIHKSLSLSATPLAIAL